MVRAYTPRSFKRDFGLAVKKMVFCCLYYNQHESAMSDGGKFYWFCSKIYDA